MGHLEPDYSLHRQADFCASAVPTWLDEKLSRALILRMSREIRATPSTLLYWNPSLMVRAACSTLSTVRSGGVD